MPQLDKLTYFTQFFWSCLFFLTFYILICNDRDGVLGISRILKLRKKLLSHRGNNIQSKDPNSLEDILRKGFNTGVSYMYSSLFEVSQWCKAVDLFGKRKKISLISCFGEIIGSGGIEGNILYLILQSSYSTYSGCYGGKNDITLIHALNGQEMPTGKMLRFKGVFVRAVCGESRTYGNEGGLYVWFSHPICSMIYGSTGATHFDQLAKILTGYEITGVRSAFGLELRSSGIFMGILFIAVGSLFKITAVPFRAAVL